MLNHLAAPRMAAVERFFQAAGETDLLGCYAWCQAVSSGLLPILGDFEVALRNRLHTSLSQHYGASDSCNWMMPRPNPSGGRSLPSLHKMNSRNKEDIDRVVKKISGRTGGAVTPDDVVAALPFGFWEQMINGLDHRSQPTGLQGAILSAVFSYAPDLSSCPHSDQLFKLRVVKLLTQIREVRNRIGHHDSIWAIPEFDKNGNIGFIPRKPRHTVISLRLFADRIAWFSAWIDPAISFYMQHSDHWWSFHALLDREALAIYRAMGGRVGTYEKVLRQKAINVSPESRRSRNIKSSNALLHGRLKSRRLYF